jgi:hypothetical protein
LDQYTFFRLGVVKEIFDRSSSGWAHSAGWFRTPIQFTVVA